MGCKEIFHTVYDLYDCIRLYISILDTVEKATIRDYVKIY